MFKKLIWSLAYFLIFFFLLYNSYNYLDADLGWHLKTGQEITQELSVPHYEKHDYTLEGKTWVDHEWLLNFISFLIYDNFSYLALSIFFVSIIIATLFILSLLTKKYYLQNKFSNKQASLFIILSIFGITAMSPHLGVRMQEITLLFMSILLVILAHFTKTKNWKTLILLLPLFYFWACSHAGFLIGFFIIFLFLIAKLGENLLNKKNKLQITFKNPLEEKEIFLLSIFSFFSFLLTLITPYGIELYSFLGDYSNTFYTKIIAEWMPAFYAPIQYRQLFYSAIFAFLLLLSLVNLYFRYQKKEKYQLDTWSILLSLTFFIMSFQSKRHFPLFFISSLPIMIVWANQLIPSPGKNFQAVFKSRIVKFYIIAGLLLSTLGFIVKTNFHQNPFDQKHYCANFPCQAINIIKENPNYQKARLFSQYDWGGYLIFLLPEKKLFIDGRLPQYKFAGHTLLEEYLDFFDTEKTLKKLDKYDIGLVLYHKIPQSKPSWFEKKVLKMREVGGIKKDDFPSFLNKSPHWKKVFEDKISIIWEKIDN